MCRGRLADGHELVDVLVQTGLLAVEARRVDGRLGQRTAAAQTDAPESCSRPGTGSTARRPDRRRRSRRTAGSCGDAGPSARRRPARRRARASRASDGCCGRGRPRAPAAHGLGRPHRDRARRRAARAPPAPARPRRSSARAPRPRGRGGGAARRSRRPRAPRRRSSGTGCGGAGSRPDRASARLDAAPRATRGRGRADPARSMAIAVGLGPQAGPTANRSTRYPFTRFDPSCLTPGRQRVAERSARCIRRRPPRRRATGPVGWVHGIPRT